MGPPERVTCPQHQGKMGSLCLKGNFEIESYVHINKIKMISLGASIKKKSIIKLQISIFFFFKYFLKNIYFVLTNVTKTKIQKYFFLNTL